MRIVNVFAALCLAACSSFRPIPVLGMNNGRCADDRRELYVSGMEAAACVPSELASFLQCVSIVSARQIGGEFTIHREGSGSISTPGDGGVGVGVQLNNRLTGEYSIHMTESEAVSRVRATLLAACIGQLPESQRSDAMIQAVINQAIRLPSGYAGAPAGGGESSTAARESRGDSGIAPPASSGAAPATPARDSGRAGSASGGPPPY